MVKRDLIVSTYHQLRHVEKTARHLRIRRKTVTRVLNEEGVMRYGQRKDDFNQRFFDSIDTPEKAYVLGLLWADGHNAVETHAVSLELAVQDEAILLQIRDLVGSTRPLRYRASRRVVSQRTGKVYHSRPLRVLNLYSKHMCQILLSLGMQQRKTSVLRLPLISPSLMNHFMRGLFDGDGGTVIVRSHRKRPPIFTVFTAKNEALATEVCHEIRCYTGVQMKIYPDGNAFAVKSYALIDQYVVWGWLYKDSTIHLARKYAKFEVLKARAQALHAKRAAGGLNTAGLALQQTTYSQAVDILLADLKAATPA